MRCRMVTIRCLCVCVLGIARLSSAAGEEPPTASELRGLILEPLRGLRFGSLTLHTTDHFMHRSVTTRHTFKDDCYRVDTYGLEDVTYVSNRDGSKKPIEIDHSTTFVERQAICGDEYINYNPAKGVDGSKFSVAVKKLSDPETADHVRGFFFDPRFIGITPSLIGFLRLDSSSNSLCENVAIEANVGTVMFEEHEVLLLSQKLDRGQIVRHWITPAPDYSVIMADVRSGSEPNSSGNRVRFTNKKLPAIGRDVSFPTRIEQFVTEIDGVESLRSVHEVDEIDFVTPVDDRVFTVLGMEPTDGTYVYTQPPQLHMLKQIRDGEIVPATIDPDPNLRQPIRAKATRFPWLLAANIIGAIVFLGLARVIKKRSAK